MSTIDPSAILTTQPPATAPTTSGVRAVFAAVKGQLTAAKADVEALEADVSTAQADISSIEGDVSYLQADVSDLETDLATHASRHLPSGADPLTTAAPETISTVDGASAEGSAESYARSDHGHRFYLSSVATAGLPLPNPGQGNRLAFVTDAEGGQLQRSTGVAWEAIAPGVSHSHDGVSSAVVAHTNLGSVGADDHHAEVHSHPMSAITDGVMFAAGTDKWAEERLLAGYATTAEVGPVVVGGDYYDPAEHVTTDLTTTLRCRVILSSSDVTKSASVHLYNVTDGALVQLFSTTLADPQEMYLDIVPGTTPNFPNAKKFYEIRLFMDGGTGAEYATLHKASLDIMQAA